MPIVAYEITLLVILLGSLIAFGERRVPLRARAQAQLPIVLLVAAIMAIIAAVATIAVMVVRANNSVKICETNESTIAGALSAYESNYGVPPSAVVGAAVKVTVHNGSTPGTFSAPGAPADDLLTAQPVDPINPTGFYTINVTASTATADEVYVITCPGIHSASSLSSITGSGTPSTGGKIIDTNGTFTAP